MLLIGMKFQRDLKRQTKRNIFSEGRALLAPFFLLLKLYQLILSRYFATMGILLPIPNAFDEILNVGGV